MTIVHVALSVAPDGRGSSRAADRDAVLPRVARALGVTLDSISAEELLAAPPGALAERFARCRGVSWGGRIAFLPETRPLHARIVAELAAAGRPGALVVDSPDAVEQAFSLAGMLPRFEAAELPGPPTRLVPLPEVTGPISEEAARALVAQGLRDVKVDPWGVFVRTYYGTLKRSPLWHVAHDAGQLVSRATHLVAELAGVQEIGGLAVRERLAIRPVMVARGQHLAFAELRVFVAFGRPVFWAYHAELEGLREHLDPADLDALGGIAREHRDAVRALAERAARVLDARFVVVDLAILEDGRLVVVEANPAHGSGFGHRAALAGAFGPFLRALAGASAPTEEELMRAMAETGIDPWGREQVFGLLA